MSSNLITPSIPQLGAIKIGGLKDEIRKAASGREWSPPEKWDHFKIMRSYRNANGRFIVDQQLMDTLANEGMTDADGKLRQIPIQCFSDDIDEILQSAYLWYYGDKLAARFDGEYMTWFYDTKEKVWLTEPIIEDCTKERFESEYKELKDKNGVKLFKLHSIFNCAILAQNARWGGVYRFRTSGDISSSELKGSLMVLQDQTRGVLRGVPMRLVLKPVVVHPVVNGKKITTTVYVVSVVLIGTDLMDIQRKALEFANFEMDSKRIRLEYKKFLTAPGENESPKEQAEIAAEFQPDNGTRPEPVKDPLGDMLGFNGDQESQEQPKSGSGELDLGDGKGES